MAFSHSRAAHPRASVARSRARAAMDGNLYDEFGNYIGPEVDLSDEEEDAGDDWMDRAEAAADARLDATVRGDDDEAGSDADEDEDEEDRSRAVTLAEDKKYYPTAEEVYGADTETLVETEDAQPLEEPIVAPVKVKNIEASGQRMTGGSVGAQARAQDARVEMKVHEEFLKGLLGETRHMGRNVCVAGHLHHGKTTLFDMLLEETHDVDYECLANDKQLRYTDTRLDEQARGISIKSTPMTLPLQTSRGKTMLFNMMDTPGHVNFSDEVTASMRLSDGVLLVVDAVEGVMTSTTRQIKHAARDGLPVCVFISKIDRLIVELKLPPADAYHKLRHTIEEINAVIEASYGPDADGVLPTVSPESGTVCFGSALYGFSFTLESFAKLYIDVNRVAVDHKEFAKRMWGDVYYHSDTRTFKKKPAQSGGERTFVQFILEPLYKVFSQVVGETVDSLSDKLKEFGIKLKPREMKANTKPLLKMTCQKIFGNTSGLVDMLATHIPSAEDAAATKIERAYSGPVKNGGKLVDAMLACDPDAPAVVMISKLIPKSDCSAFDALGRVMCGTIKKNDRVRVLGENFSPDDDEDCVVKTVSNMWMYEARYRIPIDEARAGAWVLLEGIDQSITTTATLVPENMPKTFKDDLYVFKTLDFDNKAVMKIAAEPLNPSDLPKMVEGLRKITKSYPACVTKVEESGEHTIMGTGELFLDSVMKDLREMYGEIEIKVSDPVVCFSETVVETSSLKCYAETPNKKNKLTMIAEPLDKGLSRDIETGAIDLNAPKKMVSDFFKSNYDWDALAAKSVWAFGPDAYGPNALLDDTLPSEVDKGLLSAIRDSVVQGFQWGTREGPLCDEPIREVKFKILDALVADAPLQRGGGQVIPSARRCAYSAFLMATPRLMEPVYEVEIQSPADCMSAIYTVLSKRRGHVVSDAPKPGTPVYTVKALIPAIETFGFETDLRYHTQGQAFGQSYFDHWSVVPGDPLDKTIVLRPLEPAPAPHLAREFMVKTRRRKGMSEDVSVSKFFDDDLLIELAQADTELAGMF